MRTGVVLVLLGGALSVSAQQDPPAAPAAAPPAPAVTAPAEAAPPAEVAQWDENWRDTSAYLFGSLDDTRLRLELVAMAMQLRDFCANRRVSDAFVQDRLQRFSALSGRREDCRSLVDYY